MKEGKEKIEKMEFEMEGIRALDTSL